ncbi:MAG TPA: TonB-dependent receptor plug domain-containing protein [Mucilaginibacter sp.]
MKKLLFVIGLLVSVQTAAWCQTSPVLENAVSKIKTIITDHIIEKAYLHFDRPYMCYVAGETMYFKAYVTMGELHVPSTISGILHADLIGKNNAVLQSKAILLNNGIGWGDFTLPDSLQKGSYRVRAYTNYMQNADHAYFFDKNVSVSSVNNVDRVAAADKKTGAPVLQFFPEGGNLVAGIQSKVAFKAVGADGLGVDLKGVILDGDNKEVAKIESSHIGMGTFDLLPEDGKKYKAKITYSNGGQAIINLPDAEAKGIVLAVNMDDPAKIGIEIRANRAYYKENLNKDINLLIYWSGSVKKVNTKLDNAVLGLDMPAATMKTGILQVTLFSSTGEPLSERLAFVQGKDLLDLSVKADKTVYAKRGNVTLNLNAKTGEGPASGGSFSVSVIDESKVLVDENAENTILTSLLLTSELKGYVEKPNYYFANINKDTRAGLDALMLTQGYRRFVWKQLLDDKNMAAWPGIKPERSMDLTGKVRTKAGAPIPSVQVVLLPNNGSGNIRTETTDAQGNFRFADMLFETGTAFTLKTNSKSGKNAAVITLNPPAADAPVESGNIMDAGYNGSADIIASMQSNQRGGAMTASNEQRTYLKDEKPQKVIRNNANYRSSNLGGPGHADQVITGSVFETAPSLVTALNGLARDVDFVNNFPYLKSAGSNSTISSSGSASPMLIVIDGVSRGRIPIDDILPRTVETVEILKEANSAIYGMEGGAGVMVITTKIAGTNDNVISTETAPGVYTFTPAGVYKAKEFYSPKYDAPDASKLADNRTTIFWKPNVNTDVDGNAAVTFFNADSAGTYRVVLEGMDKKGNLGRQVFKYKVQ